MSIFKNAFKSFGETDQTKIFGAGLVGQAGEVFGKQLDTDDVDEIPKFLYEIMEYIVRDKVREEGLFRKNGSKDKIDEVKEILDFGEEYPVADMTSAGVDVHSICGVLKLYFREMPVPLMTYDLYTEWIAVWRVRDEAARVVAIRSLLSRLPLTHRRMLKDLSKFLRDVAEYQESNRMGTDNLALVFAPNLLRPRELDLSSFADAGTICQLVEFILIHNEELFD